MIRSLLAIPLVLIISVVVIVSDASAQQQQGHDACARDVTRFCRAQINDGDQVVLACLRQNRAKLSKACEKVLTEHGQ
jgi:DNA-binding ferritin-like protein (Dps family)